uniref:Uncharacterized protein n=1 Tax=Oryza glumipatula TaxID=40148 RepID=A0A0E0BFJ0_9ORYZ
MAMGFACAYSYCYRSRLRQQYGLQEKPCGDRCVHWCYEPCALCHQPPALAHRALDEKPPRQSPSSALDHQKRLDLGDREPDEWLPQPSPASRYHIDELLPLTTKRMTGFGLPRSR